MAANTLSAADRTRDVPGGPALALGEIAEALSRLKYGAIELVVHDGRLVQMQVTERRRFT